MSDYDTFGTRMGRYFQLGNVPSYTTQMGKVCVHVARLQSLNPRGVTNGIALIAPAKQVPHHPNTRSRGVIVPG
jgi:hypothetical protein